MITVANFKDSRMQPQEGKHVEYIGRENKYYGLKQSPLANPFVIPADGSRETVLEKYAAYIQERMTGWSEQRQDIERLAKMAKERDIVLVCWCAPLGCHADIVKGLIEQVMVAKIGPRFRITDQNGFIKRRFHAQGPDEKGNAKAGTQVRGKVSKRGGHGPQGRHGRPPNGTRPRKA